MSFNLSTRISNLVTLVNQLVAGSVTNPLTTTLNCNNFNLTNVNTIYPSNLSLASSTGTNGQVVLKDSSNNLIYNSPNLSKVFYVDAINGSDTAGFGSIITPFQTIQYAINKCTDTTLHYTIYISVGIYAESPTIITGLSSNISIIGMTSTAGNTSQYGNTRSVTINGSFTIPQINAAGSGFEQNFIISLSNILISSTLVNLSVTGSGYSVFLNNMILTLGITAINAPNCLLFNPSTNTTKLYLNSTIISTTTTNFSTTNALIRIQSGQLSEVNYCNFTSYMTNSDCLQINISGILRNMTNTTVTSNFSPNAIHFGVSSVASISTFNNCNFSSNSTLTNPIINIPKIVASTFNFTNNNFNNLGSVYTAPFIGIGSNANILSLNNKYSTLSTTLHVFNPFGSSTFTTGTGNIIQYNDDNFVNANTAGTNTVAYPSGAQYTSVSQTLSTPIQNLYSNLNANNFNISNINTLTTTNLTDSTASNGTLNQLLTKTATSLIWKSPSVGYVFYVDGFNGSNSNLGSQTFPFQTIQYALNLCTSVTAYYTVIVKGNGLATGYPENIIISNPRLNLIGVQSSTNNKSVGILSVTITSNALQGPTNDIIAINNFVITGATAVHNLSVTSNGGYSLYLNNVEIDLAVGNQQYSQINFNPSVATTRIYITNCRFNNTTVTISIPSINIISGQLWQFIGNSMTNQSSSTTNLQECILLKIGGVSTNFAGMFNCDFTSTQDIILSVISTLGGAGKAYTISNCSFNFKSVNITNKNGCIVVGEQNTFNSINMLNCIFINRSTILANSQTPYILLNSMAIYVSNCQFTSLYSTATSQILSVAGNYNTNAVMNVYSYNNNTYLNAGTIQPSASYPITATLYSSPIVNDGIMLNKLNNLSTTTDTNLITYNSTTKAIGYKAISGGGGFAAEYLWLPQEGVGSSNVNVLVYNVVANVYQSTGNSGAPYSAIYNKSLINYMSFYNVASSSLSTSTFPGFSWGQTTTTFPNLYFPSTGIYQITWTMGCAQNLTFINSINLNCLPFIFASNDVSITAISNSTSYTMNVTASVRIQTAGPNGDYITLCSYNGSGGLNTNLSFRQTLTVTKVSS